MDAGQSRTTSPPEERPSIVNESRIPSLDSSITHKRIDPAAWDNLYIIGDVHGCYTELCTLLDEINVSSDDLLVFVGDLVRKGPASDQVVELVRSTQNMLSVFGNNERKLLEGACNEGLNTKQIRYLKSLPECISWPGSLVIHGGIDPRIPLNSHDVDTILTTRSIPPENGYCGPFWFESYEGPPRVFFGHTVLDEPIINENIVGLDTGCVYGGSLTTYNVKEDSVLSEPARKAYQMRAEAKIIEPE